MDDLIRRYRLLYSSLVSDCVEQAGLGQRCAAPGLAPFHSDELAVAVGWAHTGQIRATTQQTEIDVLLRMVKATGPGTVSVMATDTDVGAALWGGLMTSAVTARGGVGAVVDGGVRDLHQIRALGFPVWAAYRSPLDIRGRGEVVSFGDPVVFRGVGVAAGDLVFADANGVVFIPHSAVRHVLTLCEARLGSERRTEQELAGGADPVAVYGRHGTF